MKQCRDCALNTEIDRLERKAKKDSKTRNIVIDGDMEIDIDTGEVLGSVV